MKFKSTLLVFAASVFATPFVFAQTAPLAGSGTQGSLVGTGSQGSFGLSFAVAHSVQVSGLDNLSLGSYGGTNAAQNVTQSESFCVYVNGGDGYTIVPTSENQAATDDSDKFFLTGSTDDEIMYTVKFDDNASSAAAGEIITYGDSNSSTALGSRLRNCGGSANATIEINIPEQEIRDATTGSYADRLILTVAPV